MMEPTGGGSCGFAWSFGVGRGIHVAPTPSPILEIFLDASGGKLLPFITFICGDKKANNSFVARILGWS